MPAMVKLSRRRGFSGTCVIVVGSSSGSAFAEVAARPFFEPVGSVD